ncbi:MAG: hypothetical protein AB7F25_12395 [Deferribacterales bacterium]
MGETDKYTLFIDGKEFKGQVVTLPETDPEAAPFPLGLPELSGSLTLPELPAPCAISHSAIMMRAINPAGYAAAKKDLETRAGY